MAKIKNIILLDTSTILHDPACIYRFDEHDIYVILAVIDDLDTMKTHKDSNIGWCAREFFRTLDQFNIDDLTNKGVKINDKGGKLFIYNPDIPNIKTDSPDIKRVNSDNALINASLNLQKQFPKRKIVIVTKDLGLRLRSSAWQCDSQNYKSDLLEDEIYKGVQYIDITSDDEWNLLSGNLEIETKQLSIQLKLNPNEFVIFSYKEKQIACRYLNGKLKILKNGENCNGNSKKPLYMGISPKNLEQRCALDILSDDSISLVSLAGSAGVGKTILALAVALQKINEGVYDKMVIMKPIIPVGGRDLGALPGDKWEKLSSWLGPYKDNIAQLMSTGDNGTPDIEDFIKDGLIEVEAMTYIQGRSIPNSIIIVDEAENITNREARMVVERCAQGSKVILLGDLSQVENPFLDSRSCGLAHSMNGGKNMVSCASITLSKVERSSLAAIASEIFSSPEARR